MVENIGPILLSSTFVNWLMIFLGGGLGASLRVVVVELFGSRHHSEFPWGVFMANGLGCFAVGLLFSLGESRLTLTPTIRQALQAGFLGGFTTFSAFGFDTWRLLEAGKVGLGLGNALGGLVVGLAAVGLGVIVGRNLL